MSALENQYRDLSEEVHAARQEAAAARVLAGGADRDVMEIRTEIRDFRQATVASLNALREDQLDIRERMNAGFAEMRDGFADMRGKFDVTAAGLQQITELLNTAITRQSGE